MFGSRVTNTSPEKPFALNARNRIDFGGAVNAVQIEVVVDVAASSPAAEVERAVSILLTLPVELGDGEADARLLGTG